MIMVQIEQGEITVLECTNEIDLKDTWVGELVFLGLPFAGLP